jgi:hypothetical protein
MSEPIAVVVPKEFYYHEVEYVRGLEARVAKLEAALIEATAELIYLREHGKDGAVWWANESKDVWRGKAIAALSEPCQ